MATKEELLKELSDCVLDLRDDEVEEVAQSYIDAGFEAYDGIFYGLVDGMNKAAKLYEEEEYFIPELMICSDAMYNGLDVLRPLMANEQAAQGAKVVIGVIQGDTHDIGKNLVKIMLETAGYQMIDLGRDVPVERFVETVRQEKPQVVALSTLMSTSMNHMGRLVTALRDAGLRDDVKVIIGGAPVSRNFAEKIGADGYSENATEAVKLVDRLLAG